MAAFAGQAEEKLMPSDSVAFDRAADYYDRTRGFPPGVEAQVAVLMAQAGDLSRSSRVLEIGVGTGRIALPTALRVGAYYGIDLARPMLDRLREKRSGEPVYVIEGDATRLPISTGALDAVIAVHVFHLIPDWRVVLAEVTRVLRPGGVLLHGWNDRQTQSEVQKVWAEATHEQRAADGAIHREQRETFLEEHGWRKVRDPRVHRYTFERSPQEFVESIQQRHFSSMWRMSDEQIARGLAAVQAHIAAHYTDPTQTETVASSFTVQAYWPPDTV
jgi:ubiquinone/menaquinone biosynthesis C-methylase UbiE